MNRHRTILSSCAVGIFSLAGAVWDANVVCADSLWARRDPNFAYYFHDYRARNVGDLLTIVVSESTGFEGQEKRELNKDTNSLFGFNFKGSTKARSFDADLSGTTNSKRKLDGKANSTIERRFNDSMTVTVMAVMPNGNLAIEGHRQLVIGRETRILRVTGVIRPADIGPNNTIRSQYVGDLKMQYFGQGPDSNFTNQGWGGRIFNVLWPF